ncbi:orotidine-5'-phosphate decarboxylase [Eudoraea sp.]|uniref:orotidine-5'-phosphate decarboxylase n=1 Tax=Eudoraea sp. TaxID=1979955 RepID=UPI003C724737
MNIKTLVSEIRRKKSFLCIGLDTDLEKIPKHLLENEDPIFAFNKAIIDATHELCVAYKPNMAFYEAYGVKGWKALEKTMTYLNQNYPQLFTIADAKRGDIGNTATRYAKAFFDNMGFDSITVAPYMGKDSVEPFLAFKDKHTILLALTSNTGAFDFQTKQLGDHFLYEEVLEISKTYTNSENLMYVVGATKTEYIGEIRRRVPHNFLLVPGVGAQGGNLHDVCKYGLNSDIGLLINSSRGIIYASEGLDFAQTAAQKAQELRDEMAKHI